MSAAQPYLVFDAITKTYPGVKALRGVTFGVHEGTVHALMGENGAGKSTLLKALAGAHQPTTGSLRIAGKDHVFTNTSAAMAAGVAVIYQELHLVPEMTVAENIYLGHLPARGGLIDRSRLRELAAQQLRRLGENIDPDTKLANLPIGQRQMVEIAKALTRGAKVIAFDEPTSSLSAREIDKLFNVIADLRREGCAILYVTHRMEEVFRLCDACTVLRDGAHVRTHDSLKAITPDVLVKDMVGRDIADVYGYRPRAHGAPALEVEKIFGPGINAPVSLNVARGEILGLFGLVGAGRTELLKLLFGATPATTGVIRIQEKPATIKRPADAIRSGLVYCTEDRKKEGIVPVASVQENCNISARRHHVLLGGIINERWERENAQHQSTSLAVKTPSLGQLIKNLSGGNQQKVILGRWLSEDVKVLMLDEPTRGIDVGAKSEIYNLIFKLAADGVGVLVVSSDLPEVLGLADRLLVMRQGKISAEFLRADFNPERILASALPIESSAA
ncbi:L-arabinose ABC transporter ATP-binding protein AraG [Nibricoccus aquaticus]|uniref:L-arabinose ABC transporter ATP-binding protein AraG n=1 Tax=Nibricoccus aquaticus TaxID=2576891 RepID=A0A290Q6V5_9BACT|nr:L-arabinose ABC transporter ATP-binding protein AraG [Nibricoccus aquaticus]ATC64379.1 L-arabinose ABC transporter ATP-binding protein AraG [Nibricoccus aquaticus]